MTLPLPLDVRRVIPRWRNSKIALTTDELVMPRFKRLDDIRDHNDLWIKKNLWEDTRQLEFAVEFAASAFSGGKLFEALEAAEFILQNKEETTEAVSSFAKELLIRGGKLEPKNPLEIIPDQFDKAKLFSHVHNTRLALIKYPRNAIMWADLSHAYISLGHSKKSRDAMLNALFLAPDNRHILRSASRLFIHLDEADFAHSILVKRPVTLQDPWLLAAEIATATVAGMTSKLIRHSKNLLERWDSQPFHIAELSSALATLELSNGASRNARKLFQKSLVQPTENSTAQSVWANQWLNLEIEQAISHTPRTFEARALNSFLLFDWSNLLDLAANWLYDEPYSSRPAIFGSYAASVIYEDFRRSEEFSRRGLVSNPSDYTLINNLAFSLAKQNDLDGASELLKNLPRPASFISTEIALEATEGLIYVRKGDIEKGKAKYLNAIDLARKNGLVKIQALATMYYVQELLRVGEMDFSNAVTMAEEVVKKSPSLEILSLFEKIIKSQKAD